LLLKPILDAKSAKLAYIIHRDGIPKGIRISQRANVRLNGIEMLVRFGPATSEFTRLECLPKRKIVKN